ncbi:NADH-quinone oxidoreductase subunit N [Anaplasma marginale]|uniref:NADH-quinone oxidoreductase subunit N n=1 Tax=Anaplasma marginale TaxID=770 RepID=UPI000DEEC80D|nr:NADH-quinone oxidoreductase subunit N [Anaplasma marginale]KAA8472077.1 NADH-quinone oxidoreductase subunit N [Anaplasma marginale]KAB0450446.1 NADH-quinone oxidoreductase subunit N [Anaplasma marginale]RCL19564.1 NADH-quinone oxidoreductase subunit N [Anaplasma marginale]
MCWRELLYMLPELYLLGSAMIALLLGIVVDARWVHRLSAVSMGVVVVLSWWSGVTDHVAEDVHLFNGLVLHTRYTCISRMLVGVAGFVASLLFLCARREVRYEFSVVMLFATLGAMTLVQAGHFLSLYISLELNSLSSCVLVCFNRSSERASESALKFFILSALSSCIMLYGISLVYGYSTGLECNVMQEILAGRASLGATLGCAFVLVGVLFKLAVVPFHMWAVDTYHGSPMAAMAFFLIVTKSAAILLLARIVGENGILQQSILYGIISVSGLSALVGELGALRQSNIKRLLAYSNIGQLGYVLPVVVLHGTSSYAIFHYVLTSWVINAWIFSVLLRYDDEGFELASLAGMHRSSPFVAFALVVSMVSAAGFPPFLGCWPKYFFLKSIVMSDIPTVVAFPYVLLVCAVGIVPCFYCFRIARVVYFDQPAMGAGHPALPHHLGLTVIAVVCMLLSVIALFLAQYFDILFQGLVWVFGGCT